MRIRYANSDDCRFFYECRNDKEARRNAREVKHINYVEHKYWFEQLLKDSSRVAYIGEEGNTLLGVVRFTLDELTEVAIHMHPFTRRKGYGKVLLQKSIDDFLENNLANQELMATILPRNIGSIKIFEKAGFISTGRKDPKDEAFDEYLLEKLKLDVKGEVKNE